MSNLMQLKYRIKSIETTKKVTHAMRLIAISFYGQIQKRNAPLLEYQKSVLSLLQKLYQANPSWQNPLFVVKDHLNSNPLIILISTSKGLCGNFHENLITYFYKAHYSEEHQTVSFITIGSKAATFIKQQIDKENNGVLVEELEELNLQNIHQITQRVFSLISQNTQYSSVTVYSTSFISFFSQKPLQQILLPLSSDKPHATKQAEQKEEQDQEPLTEYIWEQDKNDICNQLAQTYLKSCIETIMVQSLLSEQAARFLAMENATTAATKYIASLTLQYNKTRQDLVTKEITELSAAM